MHFADIKGELSCWYRYKPEEYVYNDIDPKLKICKKNNVQNEDVNHGGGVGGYIAVVSEAFDSG